MEERKEPHGSRDSTEEESMSLSPNLPSPPVILPHQAAQQAHRTTNFFIDNILRPDFGCRKEPGYRDRSQTPGRENVNPLGARPPHTGSLCLDSNCSSDSPSSSPSSSSSSSSSSSTSSSPSSKQKSSKPGDAAGTGTGRYADSPSSIMVVSGSNGASTPTKESQPMLWPAWVYCTRYSDRPSSVCATAASSRHTELRDVVTVCGLMQSHATPEDTQTEKEEEQPQGGQAAPDGVHRRAAAETENRVPGQPVHHGAAETVPGAGTEPERVPDQDLVPEQAGEDQKGHRLQERPGPAAHGPGTVQPLHDHRAGGQGGQRIEARARPHRGPRPRRGPPPDSFGLLEIMTSKKKKKEKKNELEVEETLFKNTDFCLW